MSTDTIVVRHLTHPTEEQFKRMTEVAAAAFEHDTFNNFMVGGNTNPKVLRLLQESQIRAGAIGGSVYVAGFGPDDISAVAVWFGPGEELLSSPEQQEAGWNRFMGELTPESRQWWMETLFPEYGKLTTGLLGEGTKRASWHLQLLVTEPKRGEHKGQGRGLGTALLKEVEQHAIKQAGDERTNTVRLTVETETEAALAFYKKRGFTSRGETCIKGPPGGIAEKCTMWCLDKILITSRV